jgi:hypothetical protein
MNPMVGNGEWCSGKYSTSRRIRGVHNGLWQMIIEKGRSRVYLGVHWVFDAFAVDENNKPQLDKMMNEKKSVGFRSDSTLRRTFSRQAEKRRQKSRHDLPHR